MRLEAHCEASLRLFGNEYQEVHIWLDEFASTPLGARHRRKRHHLASIEEVRVRWGDSAAAVAKRHIEDDLREEGWVAGRDRLPRDEKDYTTMGFF